MPPSKPQWSQLYDWCAGGELACIHARIAGGDPDTLLRIEAYLHEEKVSSIPWPPQVVGMPRIGDRGVRANAVSRF